MSGLEEAPKNSRWGKWVGCAPFCRDVRARRIERKRKRKRGKLCVCVGARTMQ
ncbi:Uncharacterized protein APZ42_033790 [Daphnia magna]|uniref:Uncharacterized protein n=1 Tax=Daphnia magna TaxID=35525 RepID=A0A164KVM7_9CRUS|nr:Uncharacterized protein APZ42_033790 [Daphnia magna]